MSDHTVSAPSSPAATAGSVPPSFGDGTAAVADAQVSYTVTSPIAASVNPGMMAGITTGGVPSPVRADIAGMSQLPTVYLPPIHYTYDRDTGKLVQVTQGGAPNNMNMAIPRTTVLNANAVSTSSPIPPPIMVKSAPATPTNVATPTTSTVQQNPVHISQLTRNVTTTEQRIAPEFSQSPVMGTQYTFPSAMGAQYTFPPAGMPPTGSPNAGLSPTGMASTGLPNAGMSPTGMPRAGMTPTGMASTGMQTTTVSTAGMFTPGIPTTSMSTTTQPMTAGPGIYAQPMFTYANGAQVPMYPPGAQWHPPAEFSHQMTFDSAAAPRPLQQMDPPATSQVFANSMTRTYNAAARVFRSFDDMSAGDMVRGVQRVMHSTATDFVKAAVFRLRRLEDVPIPAGSPNRVSYSLVAYFDTATENYGVYHSHPRCAHQGSGAHLANCDLDGEVVKIPWQGEPYVFVKVVEHVNQMETVVGRLKLHVESLVRDHPLRVNIISDRNNICGSVIFEFGVGHMSYEEMRDAQDKALRAASERRTMDYQYRSNNVPDYDTSLRQHRQYQRDRAAAEYQRENPPYRGRSYTPATGEVRIPAALNHFVRWCCDITDSELY
ncbi:hypothetical protein BaOVIS_011140 [Babesia ovis]|uniref:Uncharacterized protein n=1 Tax=Babesia ovis TaxID=5869 RepID=A0A9W5T982_BABOV|nr:hypothetical protein BaOVIS_011140 [Babesia ovis]